MYLKREVAGRIDNLDEQRECGTVFLEIFLSYECGTIFFDHLGEGETFVRSVGND